MAPSGITRGLLIVSAALVSAMWFGAAQTQASHVACGDTIAADTTLDSDLLNCPSNGLVIGADDVTLDLNGHMVAGDGEPVKQCPEGEFCDAGLLNDGHDGVAVRDGSVRAFDIGVFVGRARHNRVLGISSSRNLLFGFVVAESARSLVRDSSGSNNIAPDGDGIGLFSSDHIRIVDNSFEHNPLGIHVDDSTDNLIKGNLFSGNQLGILLEADGNQVRRNRSVEDGGAMLVLGDQNVIARNRVSRAKGGIAIEKGRGNLVARNVVVDPGRIGIQLGRDEPEQIGGADNVVRRNLVRGSGADGFAVFGKDGHSLLRRNVAIGSGDDGFDVESQTATLAGNRALRNRGRGIEAVRGVTDGGGNEASGNGNHPQCTHIGCKRLRAGR